MGNCLSKFNNKGFTIYTPPLTSGHLKKVVSGIQKNTVKYFTTGVHQKYGYERIAQSSLIDVYDIFPSQSIELLDGCALVIKGSVIKNQTLRLGYLCYFGIYRGNHFKNG